MSSWLVISQPDGIWSSTVLEWSSWFDCESCGGWVDTCSWPVEGSLLCKIVPLMVLENRSSLAIMILVVVSNRSLNERWNWGETSPVVKLKTRPTECVLRGHTQVDTHPRLIFPFLWHPACKASCNTYTGQPKWWKCLIVGLIETCKNSTRGDSVESIFGVLLCMSFAIQSIWPKVNGNCLWPPPLSMQQHCSCCIL